MRRKAKIAGTLGPACDSPRVLERLIAAGMNVARLNFSHGDAADHRRRAAQLRAAARKKGVPVALMADLQGPRFRVGRLNGGVKHLVAGETVVLVSGKSVSKDESIPVSYAALAGDLSRGNSILLDDGKIELTVRRIRGNFVDCEVIRGGPLSDHKGINLPGVRLSAPALTRKDRRDLLLAVELKADLLAVSFVRHPDDVETARRLLRRAGSNAPVVSKIEHPDALERLDAILEASDGVLVARGDLGVELPPEQVPVIQKRIIARANRAGCPVMTATQMLDSMRHSERPTRAETSDVANAVLDGSDALLLTAETAVGRYPVESVRMMAKIIAEAEGSVQPRPERSDVIEPSISVTTCRAACRAAGEVGARYLLVFTQTGSSALKTARFRPSTPIVAFTPSEAVQRSLSSVWGIDPRKLPRRPSIESLIRTADEILLESGDAQRDDLVVVVSGSPVGVSGSTNLIEMHRIGRVAYGSKPRRKRR